jgi:hypothetical protein
VKDPGEWRDEGPPVAMTVSARILYSLRPAVNLQVFARPMRLRVASSAEGSAVTGSGGAGAAALGRATETDRTRGTSRKDSSRSGVRCMFQNLIFLEHQEPHLPIP